MLILFGGKDSYHGKSESVKPDAGSKAGNTCKVRWHGHSGHHVYAFGPRQRSGAVVPHAGICGGVDDNLHSYSDQSILFLMCQIFEPSVNPHRTTILSRGG